MNPTPVHRTYLLSCPANAGKLETVAKWVGVWRELATLERDYQVERFRKTQGKHGLESTARKGWTRPWVEDGRCSVTMAQQIMAQVASQLKGHLGILKNAVQALISEQAKIHHWDAHERHRLYSLNRHGLWLAKGGVKSPIEGETCLPKSTLRQGRKLLFQALRQHALPTFDRYHPQLDQRNCQVDLARSTTSKFPLWARVSPAGSGSPMDLPLVGWKGFLDTLAETSRALAPIQALRQAEKRQRQAEKRKKDGKRPVDPTQQKSLDPRRAALPHTLRLILDEPHADAPSSGKPPQQTSTPATLRVAVVLDHRAHDHLLRADYVPRPGMTVAFDLGLSVLLASSEGDLLGRNWMDQIERYAHVIDAIAAHRQRLGLPVRSQRYDAWVAKLDGFMKTEIHRMLARWVARVKPERIVIADDSWERSPALSRRMNRLASCFGKRHLKAALAKLEATHGIVVETRPGAYTSQECHACGYVDARNRQARDQFLCRCCGKRSHADVNAAKVSRDRRSVPATGTFWPHARHTLCASLNRFVERNPRPEALENRPIGRANDPRWSNPYFHTWQQHWTPHVEVAEVSGTWRTSRVKRPSAVS